MAGVQEPTPEQAAQQFAEQVEYGPRAVQGLARWLIPPLAAAWSLFQLSLPALVTLNTDIVRSIHLGFALVLVFLSYPAVKRLPLRGRLSFLTDRSRIPVLDILLAVAAGLSALYYAIDYVGIAGRQGLPIPRDLVLGSLLIVLLLEAARRALGPALPTVAALFIALSFMGPDLPLFIAFKRVSFRQLINQLALTTEGIYGVPLYVSASMVFLFVLFGSMLEKSGGGRYFVQLAFCLVGRFKGGPAKAAVLASGLTGMVSGSSIANVVTTGTFTIPLMKRCGYPAEKAAAVEVAASTNGQLMPPIMGAAAFIIAERCNIPYLAVVRAAFVPAVISYLALIYITHLEASKLGLRGLRREELPRFRPVFLSGVHFLLPLGLLVGLLLGGSSPGLSAFWAIVGLAGLIVVRDQWTAYRERTPCLQSLAASGRLLWDSLVAGGRSMAAIGVAVAAAGIIVGVMTLGPGALVTEVIAKLSGGHLVPMLLITAVASLILGMGLPTTANYIVMATLTAPAIIELSGRAGLVIPVIAAHLFCFFFGILADDTPPVGLAAYAAAAIAKSHPIKTGVQGFMYDIRTALLPFMFIFNTDLLLIGVHSWWHASLVFGTGALAMFAFAALTQNYFLVRNRIHEAVLLGAVVLVILRPDLCRRLCGWGHTVAWYAVGLGLYATVGVLQWRRVQRGKVSAGTAPE